MGFIINDTTMHYNSSDKINKKMSIEDKDRIIKNQAKVIKEVWGELQGLKRTLIDNHSHVWSEIQKNR